MSKYNISPRLQEAPRLSAELSGADMGKGAVGMAVTGDSGHSDATCSPRGLRLYIRLGNVKKKSFQQKTRLHMIVTYNRLKHDNLVTH